MSNEVEGGQHIKVILVCNSGVRKRSIISRFVSDEFDEKQQTNFELGVNTKEVCYKGEKYYLDIWDTIGNQRIRMPNQLFYENAEIVLFVYDKTNRDSFIYLKKFWIHEIRKFKGFKKTGKFYFYLLF